MSANQFSVVFLSSHKLQLAEQCLNSLALALKEAYGSAGEIELLVGYQDSGREEALSKLLNQKSFGKAKLIQIPASTSPPEARNQLLKMRSNSANWIIFIDDDVELPKDYFCRFQVLVEKWPKAKVFGGPNLTPVTQAGLARFSGELWGGPLNFLCRSRYSRGIEGPRRTDRDFILCNLIVHASVEPHFSQDLPLGEEVGFLRKVIQRGETCVYSPDLYLSHVRREEFAQILLQVQKYGCGRGMVLRENPLWWGAERFMLLGALFLFCLALIPAAIIIWPFLSWQAREATPINKIGLFVLMPMFYLQGLLKGFAERRPKRRGQAWSQEKGAVLLLAILIVLVGVCLRIYHLGTFGLDSDEMIAVGLSERVEFHALLDDTNPPLFLLLMRQWVNWLPHTEFWLRFPAFCFSNLSVALMAFLGIKVEPRRPLVALTPALLLAISPGAISSAQWCRGNSLWELATVLGLAGLFVRPRFLSAVGFSMALSTHWFALLPSGGLWLGRILERVRAKRRGFYLIALALFVSALVCLGLSAASFQLDWQVLRFQMIPWWIDLRDQLNEIFGLWLLPIGIIGFAVIDKKNQFWISSPKEPIEPEAEQQQKDFWLIALSVVFALSLLGLTLLLHRSLFLARYLTPLAVLLCWSGARQITSSRQPNLMKGALLSLWLISSIVGFTNYSRRPAPRWREALHQVAEEKIGSLWTTRSIEIAHPYLEGTQTEVRRFNGLESDKEAISQAATNGRIAIIDNFWGGILYWSALKEFLEEKGFRLVEYYFNQNTLEPIRLLIIEEKIKPADGD
jgi:hypothetical protein